MWEDPANAQGGKWVVLLRSSPHLLDHCWANLTMALIGEVLDPENMVCGVVASTRPKIDRLQVWTRVKDDVDGINLIGRRILEAMALEGRDAENLSLEFQVSISLSYFTARTVPDNSTTKAAQVRLQKHSSTSHSLTELLLTHTPR